MPEVLSWGITLVSGQTLGSWPALLPNYVAAGTGSWRNRPQGYLTARALPGVEMAETELGIEPCVRVQNSAAPLNVAGTGGLLPMAYGFLGINNR
ncbi:hypothetical protein DWB77_00415 [Streptomyces hundungensis]|uniref:Uncharacterized protein n=1 Tax=Streptomyces hundungensis TaxID=1077946 RepID=A0A387HCE5_9ACTN|nr:hypothetical protein DWB77_00415 [Streptomyces hundungensis]